MKFHSTTGTSGYGASHAAKISHIRLSHIGTD